VAPEKSGDLIALAPAYERRATGEQGCRSPRGRVKLPRSPG